MSPNQKTASKSLSVRMILLSGMIVLSVVIFIYNNIYNIFYIKKSFTALNFKTIGKKLENLSIGVFLVNKGKVKFLYSFFKFFNKMQKKKRSRKSNKTIKEHFTLVVLFNVCYLRCH